ncbi:MAG: PQQ-binding-like beta-propeller repeat protein [bacterium]
MRRTHPTFHRLVLALWTVSTSAALLGCEQRPFEINYPRNAPGAIRSVARRLAQPTPAIRNSFGKPMAFIVATRPRGIVAVDLTSGSVVWRKNISDCSSKIVVGRNFIFHRKGSTILMARHMQTGEIAWQYRFKYGNATEFFGMDADGDDLYYTATSMSGGRAYARFADVVAVEGRTGRVRWRKRANGPLGAPAARNGLVFLPYRFQYLTVLSGRMGNEIARVYVRHNVTYRKRGTRLSPILINYALAGPEGIIFGNDSVGAIRFTPALISGRKLNSDFVAVSLKRQRSVKARYWWDGYKPSMVAYTAIDRNRLLWRFAKDQKGFANDVATLQYYRYFFGFQASTGLLKWAYMHPATQVISSAHLGDRIIYISRGGRIVMLDATNGDRVWELDTKIRTHGATFDAFSFAPPQKSFAKNPPLLTVLKDVIREPDLQFQDAKIFAVTQLVKVKGAGISKILLKIVNSPKTPVNVRRVAGSVLVERASSESLPIFLKALEGRYDFLKGTAPKGVGIVARALGRIGSKRAVKALLDHLQEPLTPFSALEDLVQSLVKIGDKRIVWPFSQFLLTYRAEPEFGPQINILTSMAKALIRLGGRSERQMLTFVAEDHHTLPQLRRYLRRELRKSSK